MKPVKLFLINIAFLDVEMRKYLHVTHLPLLAGMGGGRSTVAEFVYSTKFLKASYEESTKNDFSPTVGHPYSVSHITLNCRIVKIFCDENACTMWWLLAFMGEGKYWTRDHCMLQFHYGCGWWIIDLKSN